MTTITNVGWYLFSTDTDKSWNELKINWGLENCTVYQYIYELSGVPIANETQLGNNNWSPINVGNNNNPLLTKYKAYWVHVTEIPVKSPTTFTYSDGTTTTSDDAQITTDSYTIPENGSLTGVNIGTKVVSIEDDAFISISTLSSITFDENSQLTTIGNSVFKTYNTDVTEIHIPSSVESIGDNAFQGYGSITSLEFGTNSSLTHIGNAAFYYVASNLKNNNETLSPLNITIPNNVTTIDSYAFSEAARLSSVSFGDESKLTTLGEYVFFNTDISSLSIPKTVSDISFNSLYGMHELTSINVNVNNEWYKSIDGVLFNKDSNVLIQYPINKKGTSYTIPSTVLQVENWAFQLMSNMTEITIPKSVTSIESDAFNGAKKLKTVNIHKNAVSELNKMSPSPNIPTSSGTMDTFFGASLPNDETFTINVIES